MIVPKAGRKAQWGSFAEAIIAAEAATASTHVIMSLQCRKIFLAYG